MTDSFLNGFVKRSLFPTTTTTTTAPYGNTIPSRDCYYNSTTSQNYPISRYAGYGVNAWEVLYSIYVSNQSTIGAKYTYNQALNKEPTMQLCNGPKNIFISRHGEKDPSGNVNYHINDNGIYRACQLIEYVNKLATAGTPISYIITCNPCPYNSADPSMRPQQTIGFTSTMLNIPIFIYGGAQDYTNVIDQLFNYGIFDGLNVLICWEHSAIQGLCLNIMNASGANQRLPIEITEGTDNNSEWYGDAYFNYYSPPDNLCPDGNFSCNDTNSAYYASPSSPGEGGLPDYIGPNSEYYPYWNNNNFTTVYCFSSSVSSDYRFTFKLLEEPILTCFSNCLLHIGLYQPLTSECSPSNKYSTENNCEVPSSTWN